MKSAQLSECRAWLERALDYPVFLDCESIRLTRAALHTFQEARQLLLQQGDRRFADVVFNVQGHILFIQTQQKAPPDDKG